MQQPADHAKQHTSYEPPVDTLSDIQHRVVREDGTEPPFKNAYWDHKEEGIYVDIQSGEPLFASVHKFTSGTGWPSFTQPIDPAHVVEREDASLFIKRTEVRSVQGDSHLGHVFPDGPQEAGGMRYCINSAALHFVSKAEMQDRGYGDYLHLFGDE